MSTGSTLGPFALGYDAIFSGPDRITPLIAENKRMAIDLGWDEEIRVGSGESGTTPAPAPDTEPTAAIQSDGRSNPITCIEEKERA